MGELSAMEMQQRIRDKKCLYCGSKEMERGENGVLVCAFCHTEYPEMEERMAPAVEKVADLCRGKDFMQALEQCDDYIKENPDCLELYWQGVLAFFGVIYVKDEVTGEMKPTFFNTKYGEKKNQVRNSSYFKKLQERAAPQKLEGYLKKAEALDKVLNYLNDLVKKEQDYDIFISFKSSETVYDKSGNERTIETQDKEWAAKVYKELKKRGYNAFFSPVDIEQNQSAQGRVYEPIILRALQTAKVMLLFGSKTEYLESTWVENEWRRYKYFINIDEKKPESLIVLYGGTRPSFPPALVRMSVGSMQLKNIDYFSPDYFEKLEKAISPLVGKRNDIKVTKIERKEVRKEKRDLQTAELTGFNFEGQMSSQQSLGLNQTLRNIATDLSHGKRFEANLKKLHQLSEENPKSGRVAAWKLIAAMRYASIEDLSKVIKNTNDWDETLKALDFAIANADDEAFYLQMLGIIYATLFDIIKSPRALPLFRIVRNRKYTADGKDYRAENLEKLRVQASGAMNGPLFFEVVEAMGLPDEEYKNALGEYARKSLEASKFNDAKVLVTNLLKLDNSDTQLLDVDFLASVRKRSWAELCADPSIYRSDAICIALKEQASFLDSDDEIDRLLSQKSKSVIGGLKNLTTDEFYSPPAQGKKGKKKNGEEAASVETDEDAYISVLDDFLGLYRSPIRRRAEMESIVKLAHENRYFKVAMHYCERLLTGDDNAYDAKIWWKMALCDNHALDEKGLNNLREEITENQYFNNAQAKADDKFGEFLAEVRSEQLDYAEKNREYDALQEKRRKSRKRGKIATTAVLLIVLAALALGACAFLGLTPLYSAYAYFSFDITLGYWYFIGIAALLLLLLIITLTRYKGIKRKSYYSAGARVGAVFLSLLAILTIGAPVAYEYYFEKLKEKHVAFTTESGVFYLEKFDENDFIEKEQEYAPIPHSMEYAPVAMSLEGGYTVKAVSLPFGAETLEIPSMIGDKYVVAVSGGALLASKLYIKNVILGDSISVLGGGLFKGCTSLKNVRMGKDTLSVSETAFEGLGEDVTVYTERISAPEGWKFLGKENNKVTVVYDTIYDGSEIYSADGFTYTLLNEKATLLKYTGSSGAVKVPSEIGGYPVVKVDNKLFAGKNIFSLAVESDAIDFGTVLSGLSSLETAAIPAAYLNGLPRSVLNLTLTGKGTFTGAPDLPNLRNVALKGYSSVGEGAFRSRENLVQITLSDGVKEIGAGAFEGCNSLVFANLDGVTEIGAGAFKDCTTLKEIKLPQGLTFLAVNTFENCSNLTDVTFNGKLRSVGEAAFRGCSLLERVSLPDHVEEIGDCAFENCVSLSALLLPEGLEEIGQAAFRGCTALSAVALPETVNAISASLFENCTALSQITYSTALSAIGAGAFKGCESLQAFVFPEQLYAIAEETFCNCIALETVVLPFALAQIGARAFYNCNKLARIEIPQTVTEIGQGALSKCGFSSLAFPFSYSSFDVSIVEDCPRLTSVTFPDHTLGYQNVVFHGENGAELTESQYRHVRYNELQGLSYQNIPKGPAVSGKLFAGWYSSAECKIDQLKMQFSSRDRGEKHLYSCYFNVSHASTVSERSFEKNLTNDNAPTITDTENWYCYGVDTERLARLRNFGCRYYVSVAISSTQYNSTSLKSNRNHSSKYTAKSSAKYRLLDGSRGCGVITGPSFTTTLSEYGWNFGKGNSTSAKAKSLVSGTFSSIEVTGDRVRVRGEYTYVTYTGSAGGTANYTIAPVNVTFTFSMD